MAAVTIVEKQPVVLGSLRGWVLTIDIASDGDTFEAGMSQVLYVAATSQTNAAIGATRTGSAIAFQTGGAEAGVDVLILGN